MTPTEIFDLIKNKCDLNSSIIFIAGRTGSGKSTTSKYFLNNLENCIYLQRKNILSNEFKLQFHSEEENLSQVISELNKSTENVIIYESDMLNTHGRNFISKGISNRKKYLIFFDLSKDELYSHLLEKQKVRNILDYMKLLNRNVDVPSSKESFDIVFVIHDKECEEYE